MHKMKDYQSFAQKWLEKFKKPDINYLELVDHFMADDCAALGFEMDCGHAFEEKYGKAASSAEELKRIIDSVDDIMLLGSAIYSQWRYFNHWAYGGDEILEPKNREWFITALNRLAALTEDSSDETEYSDCFLDWYAAHESILEKKLEEPSMEGMRQFLMEHPEKKMAYWYKVWDAGGV